MIATQVIQILMVIFKYVVEALNKPDSEIRKELEKNGVVITDEAAEAALKAIEAMRKTFEK